MIWVPMNWLLLDQNLFDQSAKKTLIMNTRNRWEEVARNPNATAEAVRVPLAVLGMSVSPEAPAMF